MAIKPEVIFLSLLCLIGVLWRVIGFWRQKAREAAFAAARTVFPAEERDRYCRMTRNRSKWRNNLSPYIYRPFPSYLSSLLLNNADGTQQTEEPNASDTASS